MNQKYTLLFPLIFVVGSTFGQTTDADAIKTTVRRETQSYWAADSKAWLDCWADVPESNNLYYSEQNHKVGQVAMPKNGLGMMAGRKPTKMKTEISNEQLRINGNAAFLQYDQHVTREEDGAQDYSHQTRYLEKINGVWKIIHVGSISYKFEEGKK